MTLGKPRKKRRYHHGNLPSALLEVATEILDEEGIAALTLREVARRLGVTHAAPYRHYRDKSALVAAVAEEGVRELGRAIAREQAASPSGHGDELRSVAAAYLSFARTRPALFRAMFSARPRRRARAELGGDGPELSPPSSHDRSALAQAAREAHAAIERAVAAAQARGSVRSGDPAALAFHVWAQCHGVATLSLSDSIGPLATDAELCDRLVRDLLAGLAPRQLP